LIELQYRTSFQHAWATAVELVGFLTEDQPKFDRGSKQVMEVLQLASEIIARAFEDMHSCLPDLTNSEVVARFTRLDGELNFMRMLRGLNSANRYIAEEKDMILIFTGPDSAGQESVEVRSFQTTTAALRALFELEREHPNWDIVLVRGERPEDVREAFKNYFSDARQFIDLKRS